MTRLVDASTPVNRRTVLASAAAGVGSFAGCLGGGGSDGGDTELQPPTKGAANAGVTLEVYEDFACPHCRTYNMEGLPEIESAYLDPGVIRYEHRDLPLPVLDPQSWRAHNAARSVQSRHGDEAFWEFAAGIFRNQSELNDGDLALFERLGDDLGFDGAAIRSDAANRTFDDVIEADRSRAKDLDVGGTPAFVLDGEIVTEGYGGSTIPTVAQAIEEATSANG
jgi:protein-disulfide isomerase